MTLFTYHFYTMSPNKRPFFRKYRGCINEILVLICLIIHVLLLLVSIFYMSKWLNKC